MEYNRLWIEQIRHKYQYKGPIVFRVALSYGFNLGHLIDCDIQTDSTLSSLGISKHFNIPVLLCPFCFQTLSEMELQHALCFPKSGGIISCSAILWLGKMACIHSANADFPQGAETGTHNELMLCFDLNACETSPYLVVLF